MNNYVRIFDTTLRDGEQSPGATLTSTEKLEIARALVRMGVDVIEAGFPAASPDDLEAVRRIAIEVGQPGETNENAASPSPIICGLARATKNDVDKAWEAVRHARRARIHTFIATSPIHMKYKLKMDPEQVIERAVEMVSYARSLCSQHPDADVEFSPEDAGRSDPEFLHLILGEVINAGATTLNIPDTVGYTTPEEFGALIDGIMRHTPGIENAIVSVHCHNDLGLATANTLAGLAAGARQAEVTINGIGERAGNTSLEEVVMALQTRRQMYELTTGIDTTHIARVSKMVSNYTGIPVQPNKAIVGANAFAHEAGIHQDGMLKNHMTYEIMRPEMVGVSQSRLVLGKHSGRHAFKTRMKDLGYNLDEDNIAKLFERFKDLADKKKTITDTDLEALLSDTIYQPREIYALDGLQVVCGTMGMPTATVRLRGPDGKQHIQSAVGTGPIDAAYKAIDKAISENGVRVPARLLEFVVHAVTEGIDAIGEVTVRIEGTGFGHTIDAQSDVAQPRTFGGYGADTDIVVASAKAYLAALNKVLVSSGQFGPAENMAEVALAAD